MSAPTEILIASTREDAAATELIARHHAQLAGGLDVLVEALVGAVEAGQPVAADAARADLVAFCRRELVSHAQAEEATLYRAASAFAPLQLLVAAMTAEHARLVALVDDVETATSPLRSAAAAVALTELFHPHLELENEVVVPRLAADPATSLADLLAAMQAELPTPAAEQGVEPTAAAAPGCACGCSGADSEVPELDVRTVPHAIRHATVFGAVDAVRPGGSLVLVAPHDPKPLLLQLADRTGGQLRVEYLERGPEAWRLLLTT